MNIKQYLKKLDIDINEYLLKAKKKAKKNGYNPDKLFFSDNNKYKLDYDGINFGASGYNDYIIYSILSKKGNIDKNIATLKRKNYLLRSKLIKGNWQNNKLSKNNLARNILW